jgi:hypothetical protein
MRLLDGKRIAARLSFTEHRRERQATEATSKTF